LDISGTSMDRRVTVPLWRRWASRGAVSVAIVVAAVASWALMGGEPVYSVAVSQVQFHTVAMRDFDDVVPVRGQVVPKTSTFVEATLAGTVDTVLIEDGVTVQAGQPLMRLRNPALELQTAEREAVLMQQLAVVLDSQSQLERDRQTLDRTLSEAAFRAQTARTELEKQEMLFGDGFVSDLMLKRYQADSRFASEQHETLRSDRDRSLQLAQRRAEQLADLAGRIQRALAETRQTLDGMTLRAPASGVLSGLVPKAGQRLDVGARVAQIDSNNGVKVVGTLDEFYLPRVELGQTAESVTVKDAQLVVAKVLPQVTAGRITVELNFQGLEPQHLRRGQTFEARLRLSAPTRTVVLPNEAFLADSGGAYVYRLDASGEAARKVSVRIGRKNPLWVEVLDGLQPGDRVVISSYAPFKDRGTLKLSPG
jgi:HlyD family secretion protein